jgi:NAD(P)-dependent dehydrogenase (short-subunit alcohol dehydrogenase family)
MAEPVVVVLGAAGGIGSALCQRLGERGTRLVLAGRSADKLTALAGTLPTATTYVADATRSAEVDAVFAHALATFGQVNGAVHGVGSIVLKPAHLTSDDEFAHTLTLNLQSAFYFLRAAVKAMQTSGGSIVLTSSVAGSVGLTNHEAIAAAKAGVEGLTRSAAATYAPRGIRINAVAPGLVRTPLAARITGNEASLKASTALHPLGRIGEPADVASLMAWLLDPANSWMTGQILHVDGGMATVRPR